jgi:hypothetical protein
MFQSRTVAEVEKRMAASNVADLFPPQRVYDPTFATILQLDPPPNVGEIQPYYVALEESFDQAFGFQWMEDASSTVISVDGFGRLVVENQDNPAITTQIKSHRNFDLGDKGKAQVYEIPDLDDYHAAVYIEFQVKNLSLQPEKEFAPSPLLRKFFTPFGEVINYKLATNSLKPEMKADQHPTVRRQTYNVTVKLHPDTDRLPSGCYSFARQVAICEGKDLMQLSKEEKLRLAMEYGNVPLIVAYTVPLYVSYCVYCRRLFHDRPYCPFAPECENCHETSHDPRYCPTLRGVSHYLPRKAQAPPFLGGKLHSRNGLEIASSRASVGHPGGKNGEIEAI